LALSNLFRSTRRQRVFFPVCRTYRIQIVFAHKRNPLPVRRNFHVRNCRLARQQNFRLLTFQVVPAQRVWPNKQNCRPVRRPTVFCRRSPPQSGRLRRFRFVLRQHCFQLLRTQQKLLLSIRSRNPPQFFPRFLPIPSIQCSLAIFRPVENPESTTSSTPFRPISRQICLIRCCNQTVAIAIILTCCPCPFPR